ncbi:PKD domain-containing protein [Halomontanus rarus]|uniref:PKD domain-containing protein n=1 Tax=Halomontanus rarus TaxID=3034020 RepID=UPI001A989697
MAGFLGATGTATGVVEWSETGGTIDSAATETTDDYVLGVEVINRETGTRSYYASREAIPRATLEPGTYDVVEILRDGGRLTERTTQFTVEGGTFEATATDEPSLRVLTDTATTAGHVAPGDTMTVWAGAVEQEYGMDRRPVENVEIRVALEDAKGNELETATGTTVGDGNVRLEFGLDGVSVGMHVVRVESDATSSTDTAYVFVGPYTSVVPHRTSMTTGVETTLGIYSELGGVPESNTDRTIVVEDPAGERLGRTQTFDDGIGMLSITPGLAGTYGISGAKSPVSGVRIESSELKALTPFFGRTEHDIDEPVTWAAHVVRDGVPVSNLDLVVTLRDLSTDEDAVVLSPTTNEFGQFTITFDAPSEETNYGIEIEADGAPVFLADSELVFVDSSTSSGGSGPISFDISVKDYTTGIGTDAPVTVQLLRDDEPISNETVTLSYSYRYDGVPFEYTTVKTDETGTATHTLTVPETAPDGEWISVVGSVELEDEGVQIRTHSLSIERYDIETDAGAISGGTGPVDVVATDRATGDPKSGIDVTAFGNRWNVDAETFDAGRTTTDANGEGRIELDIPDDATNTVEVRAVTPYGKMRTIGGWPVTSLTVDEPTLTPATPAPGETFTISYTNASETDVSAIAMCPARRNGTATIVPQDGSGEFSVPGDAEPGGWIYVGLVFVGANGETLLAQYPVDVAEVLTADFTVTPQEPGVGETVTLTDASTSSPDAAIATYEWELTGDGVTDETGPEITHEFAEAGEYEITLIVTDENGESDTVTKPIVVSYDDPPSVDVTGDGTPATDTTGDGLLDDVNGDGRANIVDVQALFQHCETAAVQDHAAAFNFSGTDPNEVTIADVQALYERVRRYGGDRS